MFRKPQTGRDVKQLDDYTEAVRARLAREVSLATVAGTGRAEPTNLIHVTIL